ncbi:MAG: patatin-like phospholipase family protein [Desulfuromonadales bacterium]|uniref:patatin-like phospholipase family protein n=1 Tax=Desulfuromonas sp. KJ2020 TaxID=2919173 RepID=UPI0020A7FE80|nr:patatin-like phospholipase family protein [Desulfuromonas sp. KJ2020]MCP3177085.1 patatin-like phospholipase family protein [Desulfuromonas sp. KJ2020]
MAKSIGLALGSGAARGLAHIGVLKELAENDIPVSAIAGTSMGAFIGALYAAGVPLTEMEEVALKQDWRKLARLIDPALPTSGLINGRNVASFIQNLLPVHTFEELSIPLAVVTTDIETGEHVIIKKGRLDDALRAAIAFPGVFPPVRFGDRFLVDGGLCIPVPINQVRDLGVEVTIGVCTIPEVEKKATEDFLLHKKEKKKSGNSFMNLLTVEAVEKLFKSPLGNNRHAPGESAQAEETAEERKPPGILKIFAQSIAIMENEINSLRLEKDEADLLIRPDLNGITLLEFNRAEETIQAGVKATKKVLPKVRDLAQL